MRVKGGSALTVSEEISLATKPTFTPSTTVFLSRTCLTVRGRRITAIMTVRGDRAVRGESGNGEHVYDGIRCICGRCWSGRLRRSQHKRHCLITIPLIKRRPIKCMN